MIEYTVKVYKDVTKWYLNGELHRENGPAVEHSNGNKWWFLNGKLHRNDGPAIEYENGNKWWYLNGKRLTEEEFNNKMNLSCPSCEGKLVTIEGKDYKLVEIKEGS